MKKEFVLGTANLGSSYGATNEKSFDIDTSRETLNASIQLGIRSFDTAPSYGVSESLLGELTQEHDMKIITKIPKLVEYSFEKVLESLMQSLNNLRRNSVHGLLFHDPEIIFIDEVSEITRKLLDTGLVNKIGFSTYDENSLISAKEICPEWELFQVPENIVDRRLLNSGFLTSLHEAGCEIYVRSIFLQGILLEPLHSLDPKFASMAKQLNDLSQYAHNKNFEILDLCLSYANSIPWSTGTIIAAASESQLLEIMNYSKVEYELEQIPRMEDFNLDPRNW